LVLEDQTGRVTLGGDVLPVDGLVTGVVLAVRGREHEDGTFKVTDYCFSGPGPQAPLPTDRTDDGAYVALISGLNISATNQKAVLALEMFTDFVNGQLGVSFALFCNVVVVGIHACVVRGWCGRWHRNSRLCLA
jgi:DNA polymerase delta subunit 2